MSLLKFEELNIKLNIEDKYKAHKRGEEKESLKNHIDLVYTYFLLLVQKNKLESHLDKLFEESVLLLEKVSQKEEFSNFVKYLFAKSIYWHDMGKINPNFQVDKMINSNFNNIVLSEGSNHSPLGAYLFINHSLEELYSKSWDEDEIEIIESIVYLFGYLISKHHGSIYQNNGFDFSNDLEEFLEFFKIENSFITIHKKEKRIFSNIYDYIENNKDTLYLMSKSLFSLLIISDYYATAQFMSYGNRDDLVYKDFGLIDDIFRKTTYKEFYKNQYDKNLINKLSNDFKSFKQLEKKSNENLNILRNKLFIEVRENLRANIYENLFYIEAPTGAGKTNLSLMSIIEVLQEDKSINKIFYVFPFTTLITQTYDSIKDTLNLNNSQIVQLHSKAEYNNKFNKIDKHKEDDIYGNEKTNFLDNLFMNYPITMLSHVRFFNILTGLSKNDNYIFHRLANSIVIIDEIQTYNPSLWSSIVYLLDSFAEQFNIKFIVMSATLPKIGDILNEPNNKFVQLVTNKQEYFQNPNFRERVIIETIKDKEIKSIYTKVIKESTKYQKISKTKKVKTIIEFITKKGADEFYQMVVLKNKKYFDEIFILSGTILEPRRREIINFLKENNNKNILLVTTQVVEAGVDIDMDIGFKEKSLVDSDEQLAGRINRNSAKDGNKLFLFEMKNPKAKYVYKGDKRLKIFVDEDVLKSKNFDIYYNQVIKEIKKSNDTSFIEGLDSYIDHIKNLRFSESNIKIIDMESISIFVPWCDEAEIVWKEYKELVQNKKLDFTNKNIKIKTLASEISKYTFSLPKYQGSGVKELDIYSKKEYGYLVLNKECISYDGDFKNGAIIYTYKNGLDTSVLKGENVGMYI